MLNSTPFKEYQKLLSNERWESLAQCFIENFTKLYGISKNFPIYIYLSAGLSSLKQNHVIIMLKTPFSNIPLVMV